MIIAGLQKLTVKDFPGLTACIVFTQGCNFKCPYCHNSQLIDAGNVELSTTIDENEFFSFLNMCLQKDPNKRSTVKDLKESKFIISAEEASNKLNKEELLEALGNTVKLDNNNNIVLNIEQIYFKEE